MHGALFSNNPLRCTQNGKVTERSVTLGVNLLTKIALCRRHLHIGVNSAKSALCGDSTLASPLVLQLHLREACLVDSRNSAVRPLLDFPVGMLPVLTAATEERAHRCNQFASHWTLPRSPEPTHNHLDYQRTQLPLMNLLKKRSVEKIIEKIQFAAMVLDSKLNQGSFMGNPRGTIFWGHFLDPSWSHLVHLGDILEPTTRLYVYNWLSIFCSSGFG